MPFSWKISSTDWTTLASRSLLMPLESSIKSSRYWPNSEAWPETGSTMTPSRAAKGVGKNSRTSTVFRLVRSRAA